MAPLPLHALSHPLRSRGRRLLTALVIAGTLLGSSFALAGPAAAAGMHHTAREARIARAVEKVMNAERRAHHLKPLHFNHKLRKAARWHNLSMARHDEMAHQLPGEAYFATRISRAGYHWTWAGENIGWNSRMTKRGVVALEKFMYNERAPFDGHRQNILNRHYRSVGIDVYFDRAHHKVWLTTDFGRA